MMMGTTSSSGSGSGSSCNLNLNQNHNVFTAAQWGELEQQALIYKYMVSGVPVPTDLILSVRRSLFNSSSTTSSLLSNQHTLGVWEAGSFQYNNHHQLMYGYGRKIDLEPGRCRRTDGKKWRCSKEAYPDSKYCERHMHRGRNRSRKPVEFSSSSTTCCGSSSSSSTLNISSSSASTASTLISKSLDAYPQFSSSSANQTNFMDSSAYSHQTLKDYRYLQGMKNFGGEDEKTAGGAYFHVNNDPNNYTNTHKISPHHNCSHFNFQNLLKQHQNKQQQQQQETLGRQHCFVMGTDFVKSSEGLATKSGIQIDRKADETTSSKQPFHHFFAPPKHTQDDHAWVEIDQQQNHHHINEPKSPLSTQDLFQSKPRPYW